MTSNEEFGHYLADREQLILQDRTLRVDHSHEVTEAEKLADRIIRDIRAFEAQTIWSADYPDVPHPFPGMEFLTGKNIIVQTKLFEILTKMPKGAVLHAHLDATVDANLLYEMGLAEPNMHIAFPAVVTASNVRTILPTFFALSGNQPSVSITADSYVPMTFVPLKFARDSFPEVLGGPVGFDRMAVGAMTINPSEAYVTHNTLAKIWQKFLSTFRVIFGLVRYKPIWRKYVRKFILTSIADGISYVEPRVNFFFQTDNGKEFGYPTDSMSGSGYTSNQDLIEVFEETINQVKAELQQEGREEEFIGGKIIYCTVRVVSPENLVLYIEECIQFKKKFPHLIAGFDIVGDENYNSNPLSFYAEKLLWFKSRQKEEGVNIPFILHAGETLGDGSEADMNLYDAILLGTKRIGHGFSLIKHPKLMDLCRERNIALEVCPISNEILRLTSSMPMHPLSALFNHGVPVCLSHDDPSVFGNMGLSYDYYQVLVSSDITGLIQLGCVARDSFKYSMLDPSDKQRGMIAWEKHWKKFLSFVIMEWGGFSADKGCAAIPARNV